VSNNTDTDDVRTEDAMGSESSRHGSIGGWNSVAGSRQKRTSLPVTAGALKRMSESVSREGACMFVCYLP
jgi:hypothetical protein